MTSRIKTSRSRQVGKLKTITSGVEWIVENFDSLLRSNGSYDSPSFAFCQEAWNLVLDMHWYPDKNGIYLRLHRETITQQERDVGFSFTLKNRFGEKCVENRMRIFGGGSQSPQNIDISPLISEFVPEGILIVICRIWCVKICTGLGLDRITIYDAKEVEENSIDSKSEASAPKTPDLNETEDSGEGCTCGSSSLLQKNKVLRDFKELFLRKEECDVVIKLKGREFPAHKNILIARSPVLASTFRSEMKEKATGIIEVEDCDPSSFHDFLCFLYCGVLENLSQENVFSLFATADKYDVQDLRSECLEFLKKNLCAHTFCDTITLALQHSETELIRLATDFFTKNAPEIVVSVKWQQFLADNPTHSNELLIKLIVPNKKSNA